MIDTSVLTTSAPNVFSGGKGLAPGAHSNEETLRKRAVEFEAIYLAQMLQPMFNGLSDDGPFGAGVGGDTWRSLQVQEFGKSIAESGGVGIADAVARELIQAQESREATL
jgi:peptidoglycan hydrolase FlgJ